MDNVTQVLRMAQAQSGVFTAAQAGNLGVCSYTLSSLVSSAAVRRLARGAYAVGSAPTRAEDAHIELCRALLLLYPDAVLAGPSALLAHHLPVWGCGLSRALLERPLRRQLSRSGALLRPLSGDVVTTWLGPAVPIATAVVQASQGYGAIPGVVAADRALHSGAVTREQLEMTVAGRLGHRHIQRAHAMLRLSDARSESVGESLLRVALTCLGVDLEPQFVVIEQGQVIARADFRVRGTRVLIEFDGRVKYDDGGVEALWREKKREDRLRRLGWSLVRVTWADLDRPRLMLSWVRAAAALSGSAPSTGRSRTDGRHTHSHAEVEAPAPNLGPRKRA